MRSHFVDAVCSCGWREPLTVYGPPVLQAIAFACPRCLRKWRLVGGEDLVDGAWAEDLPPRETIPNAGKGAARVEDAECDS